MKKGIINFWLVFLYCATANALPGAVNVDEPKTIVADKIEYDLHSAEIKTVGKTTVTNQSGQTLKLTDSSFSNRGTKIDGKDVEL